MVEFGVGITGVGSFVPEKIMTNSDLEKIVDTSNEWIIDRTGIEERRIAEENIATSDIAAIAAQRAMEDAKVLPEEIDLILVATISPDYIFPSTACMVQKHIGATNAAAFDINAGCTGFIYALTTAKGFVKSGIYKKVLVIGAETLSKIVNWKDRNTCVLFGDGAGACIVEPCEDGFGMLAEDLGSDGSKGDVLIVPAGGSKKPTSLETVEEGLNFIKMDGREVFKFAVRIMEKASNDVLKKAGLTSKDIDLLVPHQANIRIIDAALKKLDLEKEKVFVNLEKYGNTSAASIPVALDEALDQKRIRKGDNLLLVAFGAGLTWGGVVLKWNKEE
ncbi:beta-ketoacyl-ACP synthase III [Tissierella creatinophila]|uniref:Beta-ketoacyl-[acyl-carrier-protein] synthase III n=1 Tax=Tissierella creatinophila DSM 6911 TaxID=1123403 RepID=A0A1U7M432_TISCR|nr:beta-ketoacyl-ACP synthase III [Tissierella creatinophila]OLS02073.1 3-oxoacyl-[acyl-carrier-protein] synthase 3 [Tissierella creatinophila DSM 6911]